MIFNNKAAHFREQPYYNLLMLRSIFIMLLCAWILKSNAQFYIGAATGITYNSSTVSISELAYTKKNPGVGISCSIMGIYRIDDVFFLKLEPTLIQKNHSFYRTDLYEGLHTKFTNSYFQLPLKIAARTSYKQFSGYINTGIYGAYWNSKRIKGTIPDIFNVSPTMEDGTVNYDIKIRAYNEKLEFNPALDNRIEVGVNYGMGICYALTKNNTIFIETSQDHALNSQQKRYRSKEEKVRNQTLVFQLGFLKNLALNK
jgi:hypothetical protein